MAVQTIWQEEFTVKSSDTDFQTRLKLSIFFTWMQDAAANHANHLGVGYHELMKRELAWVLSRKKVRFFDFPKMGEKVVVQTWPKGIQQKLFFMRDYHMLGESGEKYASASSAYVLMSPQARRMLLPQVLSGYLPDNGGLNALDETLEKIPAVEALEEQFTVQAGYSAVDLMNHVNNTRYIDWASDCFSFEEHSAHSLSWLQINYINEIKPGERVTLYKGAYPGQPGAWYIAGQNLNTGQKAFEVALGWEE